MATGRRRGRAIIYIALILILLLVLVFAVLRFGQGLPGVTPGPSVEDGTPDEVVSTPVPQMVEIVVTSQEIKRGQEVTDDRITTVEIPAEDYTEGIFFQTREEVIGARALFDLRPATPLTSALVVPVGTAASVPSFEIPRGMVAISVPLGRLSSVGYGLQKGDHVNIIASLLMVDLDTNWQSRLPNRSGLMLAPGPISGEEVVITSVTARSFMPPEYTATGGEALSYLGRIEIDPTSNNPMWVVPNEPQRPRLVSQTLIQDVVVLQLGNFQGAQPALAAPAPEDTADPTVQDSGEVEPVAAEPARPDIITLIVNPQDAVTLNYLMLSGANLNLVLRSAGDDQRIDTEAVTLQFVLDQYRIPNPAKLPYGTERRIDTFPERVPAFPEPGPTPTPLP